MTKGNLMKAIQLMLLALLAGCSGGKIELTGSPTTCLVDEQCPAGSYCMEDFTCSPVDLVVEPDLIPESDLAQEVEVAVQLDLSPELDTKTPDQATPLDLLEEVEDTLVPDVGDDLEDLAAETDVEQCIPEEEVCDGLDNDCDDEIDEELGTVTCGIGLCEHVVDFCLEGVEQECDPLEGAQVEACDGVDNDCDGDIDEDLSCASVFGRTLSALSGKPIGGVAIVARPAGECDLDDDEGSVISADVSPLDGAYLVPLPAGDFCLEATAEGYHKMITEDFSLAEGDLLLVNFYMQGLDNDHEYLSMCGRVTDQVSGAALPFATVTLGASSVLNLVASTSTEEHGGYCFGGVWLGDTVEWYGRAMAGGHFPQAKGPVSVTPNVVRFMHFDLEPDDATLCFEEGFEVDNGWSASDPHHGVYWHRRVNDVTLNSAYPECVTISDSEICVPDPDEPLDDCQICATAAQQGCIPEPAALPRAVEGLHTIWFGRPGAGNYLGTGSVCEDKNGGISSGGLWGDYTSPGYPVGGGLEDVRIVFSYWFEIEGQDPNQEYDRMEVQVSADGVFYYEVGSLNPDIDTDGDSDKAYTSAGYFKTPIWSLADIALEEPVLGEVLASGVMFVRFYFETGDAGYNGFRGWVVDGLRVIGTGCELTFPL